MVERARMVKDADELKRIRAAVALGAKLFDRALEVLRPGVKETEVAAEMELAARRAGAEEMSFPDDHCFGSEVGAAAWPRFRSGDRPRRVRGLRLRCYTLRLLFGSDAHCVGGPVPEEARQAYEAVREAQQAAIDAVRPGVAVGEVDAAARKVLRKAGLGRYFTHSTGHGVGLEIHEAPRVADGQREILQPGMVITIEPGVYFPGKWGVRIEDMVAVTASGCEVLTPTSKDFLAV